MKASYVLTENMREPVVLSSILDKIIDRKSVNDAQVVYGLSVGCKAKFYILSTLLMACAASFCAEVVT